MRGEQERVCVVTDLGPGGVRLVIRSGDDHVPLMPVLSLVQGPDVFPRISRHLTLHKTHPQGEREREMLGGSEHW